MDIRKSDIIAAMRTAAWGGLSPADREEAMESAVRHANLIRGTAAQQDTVRIQASELTQFVTQRYVHLHAGEIALALDSGTRGEYGNRDTFVTIASMQTWIRLYADSQTRREAVGDMLAEDSAQHALPGPDTTDLNRRFWTEYPQMLYRYAAEYGTIFHIKGTGSGGVAVEHTAAIVYDMLDAQGKFDRISRDTVMAVQQDMEEWRKTEAPHHREPELNASAEEDHRKCLTLERYLLALIGRNKPLTYDIQE